jgi:hypothetical protein
VNRIGSIMNSQVMQNERFHSRCLFGICFYVVSVATETSLYWRNITNNENYERKEMYSVVKHERNFFRAGVGAFLDEQSCS